MGFRGPLERLGGSSKSSRHGRPWPHHCPCPGLWLHSAQGQHLEPMAPPANSTWACGVRGPGEEESVGTPPANQGHRGRLPSCSDPFASLGLPWGRWASRQPWPPWDSWSPWSEGEQALPLQFTWWDTLLEWVGWSDCSDSDFHLQGSPGWAGPRGEPVSCFPSQRLPRALSAGWGLRWWSGIGLWH